MADDTEWLREAVAKAIHEAGEAYDESPYDRVDWDHTTNDKRRRAREIAAAAIRAVEGREAEVHAFMDDVRKIEKRLTP